MVLVNSGVTIKIYKECFLVETIRFAVFKGIGIISIFYFAYSKMARRIYGCFSEAGLENIMSYHIHTHP